MIIHLNKPLLIVAPSVMQINNDEHELYQAYRYLIFSSFFICFLIFSHFLNN